MINFEKYQKEYRQTLAEKLTREELLEVIEIQDPEIIKGIQRIEWVFENKLQHLNWQTGEPISGRPLTNQELSLLIDVPFEYSEELASMGLNENQQREYFISADPVLWARKFLNATPRVYQIIILRHMNAFKVLRAGRRLGKSWTMAVALLWYSYITNNGRSLVVTPMRAQADLIYEECLRLAGQNDVVEESIGRNVRNPNPEISFKNGSTIRFFTSGMKSAGKSDVTRGQEAHFIVLDELDYMGEDDMDALLAMLQKTDENQPDKRLFAASTPSGRKAKLWEWSHNKRFQEFWYPSYCFEPGHKVNMADGSVKFIEDIQVGDLVLTEAGPNKVSRTFERDYHGNMKLIKTYGNNEALKVTPEHPFSSCRRSRKHNPSYEGRRDSFDWDWVEAGSLTEPEKRNSNSGSWIRYVYDTTEKEFDIPIASFNKHFTVSEDGRVYVDRVYQKGHGKEFVNSLPEYVGSMDESLAILAGWYLAEGHVEGFNPKYDFYQTVGWTLNANEVSEAEEIQEALNKLDAGQANITYRKKHNTQLIRVNNPMLASLLVDLAGKGSCNKILSQDIMQAPVYFQRKLLDAYGNGDGWNHSSGVDFRTSSEQLASQLGTICSRLGFIPSITMSEESEIVINPGYGPYKQSKSWLIGFNECGRSMLGKQFTDTDGEAAVLIKSIDSYLYHGKVYNFEVENTNSYLVNNLLVHNCNPFWSLEQEEFFRDFYSEIGYRHEIEADWGEDADGVYPRKYVDAAFVSEEDSWDYKQPSVRYNKPGSFTVFGVDWDKYGAGTNIVVLEVFDQRHEDPSLAGKIRLIYREETIREEYTLTKAVDKIIHLNNIFDPRHIYIDRGYGDTQYELLKKHGVENPQSGLVKKIKGISFASVIEMPDPYSGMKVKKEIKPFMIDTLRSFLERGTMLFSSKDEELYLQLISYIVSRITSSGRPVFEMSGSVADHCHDALILASLAIKENYDDLMFFKSTNYVSQITSNILDPLLEMASNDSSNSRFEQKVEQEFEPVGNFPGKIRRTNISRRPASSRRGVSRRMF